MRTRALVTVACALGALGAAAPASAYEVLVDSANGYRLVVQPEIGEGDAVLHAAIRRDGSGTAYQVQASTGTLTSGAGCNPPDAGGTLVNCPKPADVPWEAAVFLSGGNDALTLEDVRGQEIHGGAGDDVLKGGTLNDLLFGEDGDDDLDGRGAPDDLRGGRDGDKLYDTGTDNGPAGHGDVVTYVQESYGFELRPDGITVTVDDGQANDGAVDDGAQGERDNVGAGLEFITGTQKGDTLTGSSAPETITGGLGNDTIDGGGGSDSLSGNADVDTMKARDGVADTLVNCDSGTTNSDAGEVAEVDAESIDANVVNCETVQRAATQPTDPDPEPPGPSEPTPPTPRPRCLRTADMYLRPDYDVDRALDGKMRIQVYLPVGGWTLYGFVSRGQDGRTGEALGRVTSERLGAPGLATVKLPLDSKFKSEFAGKSRQVMVNVVVEAKDCPAIMISDTVQLAPKVDNSSPTVRNGRPTARAAGSVTITQISGPTKFSCLDYMAAGRAHPSCPDPVVPPADPCAPNVAFTNVISVVGCLKQPAKKDRPHYWTADKLVQMNGLYIEPVGGDAKLYFDTKNLKFGARGGMKIYFKMKLLNGAEREIVLFQGSKEFTVDGVQLLMQEQGISRDADILGFKFAADLKWQFHADGLRTTASLRLPQQFGGAEATVKLDVDKTGHIELRTLDVTVARVEVYGFTLRGFHLKYTRDRDPMDNTVHDSWYGVATAIFPQMGGAASPPEILVEMRWEDGKFVTGRIAGTNLGPLGHPAVVLQSASGELTLGDPLKVDLKARIAFGPSVLPGAPPHVAAVDGRLQYSAPTKSAPGLFHLEGLLALYRFPPGITAAQAQGELFYSTDGKFKFGGNAVVQFGPDAFVNGRVDGSLADGKFEAHGDLKLKVGRTTFDGAFYASNDGVAACARAGKIGAGFTFKWQTKKLELFSNCGLADWNDFVAASGRVSQGSTDHGFTVPAGTTRIAVEATGSSTAPQGVLIAPNGSTVQPVTSLTQSPVTYWLVERPVAGAWKLRLASGHVATRLRLAKGEPADTVTAEIERDGKEIEVTYKSSLGAGEGIAFYERAGEFMRKVKDVTRARGDFDFKPADIRERKRQLVAVMTRGGVPSGDEIVLGSFAGFAAPLPTSLFPIRGISTIGGVDAPVIRSFRKGGATVLEWGLSGGATGYEIDVKHGDGRRQVLVSEGLRNTRLELRTVDPDHGFTVRIRGFNDDFEFGKASSYTVKAGKPDKPKPQRQIPDPLAVGYLELG
jgi:hypothetical protein